MSTPTIRIGVLLGLVLALTLYPAAPARAAFPSRGALLSDCDGPLRELVIQYVPEAGPVVETVYRQFLPHLSQAVVVRVVCPDREAFDDLVSRVGPVACRLDPVLVGHTMTGWSRDRWLAFGRDGASHALIASPDEEAGHALWAARAGDARIGDDLARALPHARSWRSKLVFDGGDFVADGETVFVSPRVAQRNIGRTMASEADLRLYLSRLLRRDVVLLPEAPDHHAGMYLMLLGEKRALVGDPSLAQGLADPEALPFPIDRRPDTQARFDAVAAACRNAGYVVTRVPVVPGRDGRTYVTYLNVIIDQSVGGQRTVYMPVFRGAEALDETAASTWQAMGFRVRRVDCTNTYRQGGSLRCLVNVLARGGASERATPHDIRSS